MLKDVLNEGIIDEETIQVIFGEVGATSRVLSFDQFKEAVGQCLFKFDSAHVNIVVQTCSIKF